MDAALLDTGQVKHRRDDGFHYRPPEPVDWMVCDMVESPSRIARSWRAGSREGWCRESHLQPEAADEEALGGGRSAAAAIIDEALGGAGYYLRVKQLYHDREEVTGYLARRGAEPVNSRP